MTLQLPLKVIFVIVDDSLVGDRDENLFSLFIGEVMDAVIDVIVEADSPLQFEGACFAQVFLLRIVLTHC